MPAGQFTFQPAVDVADALARGAALPHRLSPDCEVALYAASLQGESLCLGQYQHEEQALGTSSKAWLRRATGGVTLGLGRGILYVALALAERSTLMKCPPGRLLNRNVRGVLNGLRHSGLSLNYFGRDFLSLGAEPAIYVGWDIREGGQVLLSSWRMTATARGLCLPVSSRTPSANSQRCADACRRRSRSSGRS